MGFGSYPLQYANDNNFMGVQISTLLTLSQKFILIFLSFEKVIKNEVYLNILLNRLSVFPSKEHVLTTCLLFFRSTL